MAFFVVNNRIDRSSRPLALGPYASREAAQERINATAEPSAYSVAENELENERWAVNENAVFNERGEVVRKNERREGIYDRRGYPQVKLPAEIERRSGWDRRDG